jgi:hypothetical protein
MKKFLITFSLLLFSSQVLMADLKPQYSSDVNALKPEFAEKTTVKIKKKKKEKKSTFNMNYMKYTPSFMQNSKKSVNTQEKKTKLVVSSNRDVKIIKVIKYADITNYSLTHKQLTKLRRVGSISRTEIIKIANSVKAQKVLIYILRDTRYIYFYQN